MAVIEDEIVAEMAGLDDSVARYRYLVDAARSLAPAEQNIRQDTYAVPGCQSRVWIRLVVHEGTVRIEADSDAAITRGIIALLVRVLDGRSVEEVRSAELGFLDRTGLRHHLSPSRANGLATMVEVIRGV